ncbi:metalloregulator ArsR/SmtB family transcription factor [Agrobacterium rhizogenes]|uniref:ArsR/SmtB family transcription factor n=1 Tax=Agrobacterium tumefaciens TaxID=358 RepID=UPI001EED9B66|nr:metalloregulator ArsR/SmtB family transcription factor [Agrobacterium tumefaciens]MCZ7497333.1 metalloregulator ArsR/SmtB family transcription factor [Rhizobium rhizogenes]
MKQPTANVRAHAQLLAVMGNEKRLLVLLRLLEGEVTVGQLAEEVELSQSALSQHLAILRKLGLVSTRREAQLIFYSTENESVKCVVDALRKVSFSLPYHFPQHAGASAVRRAQMLSQMKELSPE